MNVKTNIADLFSENLFWDTDTRTLHADKHARFIVERVLMRGRMPDWLALNRLYTSEQIKEEALQIRYLDKVTLSFCSMYFDVPQSEFRCFTQPQSIQQLWQF
jgi:hypothetical protein